MGLFGGKNSIFNQAARTVSNSVSNPTKTFNTAFGTKLPTSINIGGREVGTGVGVDSLISQARASLRDIKNTQVQAGKDRDNAQKGEIGKFYSGQFDTLQNLNPYTVGTRIAQGEDPTTSLKKIGGSYLSMGTAGVIPYAGKSSAFQNFMRDENVSKNSLGFSENFAGYSRGASTLTDTGNLTNDDRNNIIQSYVKVGAVAGFGGWLNSLFSGPAAAAPGAEGAVVVESGTPYYAGGQVASADIAGTSAVSATGVSAGTTAAAATPWGSYLSNAALGYTLLTGKQAPTSIGDIFAGTPDQGGGGGNYWDSNPYADVTGNGAASYGGDGVQEASMGMNPIVLTGIIVAGYLVYRRFSK